MKTLLTLGLVTSTLAFACAAPPAEEEAQGGQTSSQEAPAGESTEYQAVLWREAKACEAKCNYDECNQKCLTDWMRAGGYLGHGCCVDKHWLSCPSAAAERQCTARAGCKPKSWADDLCE